MTTLPVNETGNSRVVTGGADAIEAIKGAYSDKWSIFTSFSGEWTTFIPIIHTEVGRGPGGSRPFKDAKVSNVHGVKKGSFT